MCLFMGEPWRNPPKIDLSIASNTCTYDQTSAAFGQCIYGPWIVWGRLRPLLLIQDKMTVSDKVAELRKAAEADKAPSRSRAKGKELDTALRDSVWTCRNSQTFGSCNIIYSRVCL